MNLKLTRLLLILTGFLFTSAFKGLKLPLRNEITAESLAFVVRNIGYNPTSTFHVSYSAHSDDNAHRQASIINDFLLKTFGDLTVSVDDLQLYKEPLKKQRTFTLLLIDSLKSFRAIDPILNFREYDTRGKHLVLVTQETTRQTLETLIEEVFAKFFEKYIVNVELVVKNLTTGFMDFYTFFPVSPSYCFKAVPVLHNTFNGTQLTNGLNLFPRKFENFFGCSLTVATFPYTPHVIFNNVNGEIKATGIDLTVLYAVSEKLNFTAIVYNAIARGINSNGSLTGAVGMMYEKRANITLGGYSSAAKAMLKFSPSVSYLQTAMVFALPPLQEYSPLERLFIPFESDVWIITGLTFGLTYVTSVGLNAYNKPLRDFIFGRTVRYPLFEMVVVYLGGGVARLPKGSIARNVILQWLIVSLVLSSCYKAVLFSMLKTGFIKKYPLTVEEMVRDGYVIDVPIPLMQNIKDGPFGRFSDSLRIFKFRIHAYYAMLQNGSPKHMVVETKIQLEHYNSIYYKKGILPSLRERLFIFPLYFYYQKDSYLVERFDDVLIRFVESGLVTFWENSVLNFSHLENMQAENTMNPLLMQNFQGCFALCGVLIACSIGAFILEILSKRMDCVWKVLFYLRIVRNK